MCCKRLGNILGTRDLFGGVNSFSHYFVDATSILI